MNALPRSPAWQVDALMLLAALAVGAWLMRLAVLSLSGSGLYVDEAQYWWWSNDLQWGYFSKPPVVATLIALSTNLFGTSVIGVKALAMACYPAAAAVLYALGRDIAGTRAGLWAAAVFLASPLGGLLGLAATTDAPLLLCWAVAMWAAWRAVVMGNDWAWLLWALALGAGLLSKYTTAALVPGLVWFAWRQGGAPALARAVAASFGAALIFSPHLLWNADWDWPTVSHTVDSTNSATGGSQPAWLRLALLFVAQTAIVGPLAIWLGLRGTTVALQRPRAALDLLVAGSALLLVAGAVQALRGRVEVNWLAPAHLAFALAIALRAPAPHAPGPGRTRTWMLALTAQAVLVAGYALLPSAWAAVRPGQWPPPALDPWARMRGWEPALAQLEPVVARHRGSVLVASSRQAYAQSLYAWRRHALRPAGFNPDGEVSHHFEMKCPWSAAARLPGPFLLLTEGPPAPELLAAFGSVRWLGRASAPRAANRRIDLELHVATDPVAVAPGPHPERGCR